jgi:hypothetical protein
MEMREGLGNGNDKKLIGMESFAAVRASIERIDWEDYWAGFV